MGSKTKRQTEIQQIEKMMSTEYSKFNCQDNILARATGFASANAIREHTVATEELVAELTECHSKQIEALIKSNNAAIQKLTAAILSNKISDKSIPRAGSETQTRTAKSQLWVVKKSKLCW